MSDEPLKFSQRLEVLFEAAQIRFVQVGVLWRKHTNRRTIIAVLIIGTAALFSYWYGIRPPSTFPSGELVSIPSGQSLATIASTLESDHVIQSAFAFGMVVRMLHEDKALHAGDYIFKEPLNVFEIAQRVSHGSYGLEPARFRIPDGATTAQMADIFMPLQRFNKDDFLSKAKPQEGYLFPDTYFFLPNATADSVISAMRSNFDSRIASVTPEIASSSHSLADIITMASIVEREAWDSHDRHMIAGVLWRRLKIGMLLQTDATFLYTIGKGSFQLTIADLKSSSPYNTYVHKGLPPTPIGSPSFDSIDAALEPIDQGYLYYLADSNGVTHYAKTYAQQLANERLYLGK